MAFDVGRQAPDPNPARVGLLFPDHPPPVGRRTATMRDGSGTAKGRGRGKMTGTWRSRTVRADVPAVI